jgi:hypothetical protein
VYQKLNKEVIELSSDDDDDDNDMIVGAAPVIAAAVVTIPAVFCKDLYFQVLFDIKNHELSRAVEKKRKALVTGQFAEICHHYQDDNPFNDDIQNYLFGRRFAAVFGASYKVNFQYAGFYMEYLGLLYRHVDTENGGVVPYSHGASFSYLVVKDNKLWRVNMIFAARKPCTDFMVRYRAGFPPISGFPCSRCPMDGDCAACVRSHILFPSIPKDNL